MIQRFAPQKTEIVKIKATWNPRILPGESAPQIRRYCPGSTQQDKATRYEATYRARRQATIQRLLPRENKSKLAVSRNLHQRVLLFWVVVSGGHRRTLPNL